MPRRKQTMKFYFFSKNKNLKLTCSNFSITFANSPAFISLLTCSSILRFFGFSSRIFSTINDHSTIQEGETSSCLKEDALEDLACFPLLQEENDDECTFGFLVNDI